MQESDGGAVGGRKAAVPTVGGGASKAESGWRDGKHRSLWCLPGDTAVPVLGSALTPQLHVGQGESHVTLPRKPSFSLRKSVVALTCDLESLGGALGVSNRIGSVLPAVTEPEEGDCPCCRRRGAARTLWQGPLTRTTRSAPLELEHRGRVPALVWGTSRKGRTILGFAEHLRCLSLTRHPLWV